jgi:hypothetical protein
MTPTSPLRVVTIALKLLIPFAKKFGQRQALPDKAIYHHEAGTPQPGMAAIRLLLIIPRPP